MPEDEIDGSTDDTNPKPPKRFKSASILILIGSVVILFSFGRPLVNTDLKEVKIWMSELRGEFDHRYSKIEGGQIGSESDRAYDLQPVLKFTTEPNAKNLMSFAFQLCSLSMDDEIVQRIKASDESYDPSKAFNYSLVALLAFGLIGVSACVSVLFSVLIFSQKWGTFLLTATSVPMMFGLIVASFTSGYFLISGNFDLTGSGLHFLLIGLALAVPGILMKVTPEARYGCFFMILTGIGSIGACVWIFGQMP
ncbi:MAG: hypothetical protein NUW37_14045 [Planctomycetes bacterium]|nr:hypothetical protein [Planctomycetota bacterium]